MFKSLLTRLATARKFFRLEIVGLTLTLVRSTTLVGLARAQAPLRIKLKIPVREGFAAYIANFACYVN
ncbi:hypothetical protein GBA52_019859 [Prunus armeniaca]|nr:hypothetical protein GBA52_019859 [Prunus armeniaca]